MLYRPFGSQPFSVSAIGYGAGHIGSENMSFKEVDTLLNTLVDWGITLIDTARGYHLSEERIGQALQRRRAEVILSTKIGYGVPGVPDWTYDCIIQGVDQALQFLKTDYLDIAHLHSCPQGTLEAGEVIAALQATIQAGKVRVGAYSGENQALQYAIESGAFGSLQTSVNLTDQRGLRTLLPQAQKQGMGVIAKRPLANAFWRFKTQPQGDYCEPYWLRWQAMGLAFDLPPHELALRFVAYAPGVHSAIIGSTQLKNIRQNLDILEKGPLPDAILNALTTKFQEMDANWEGQI